MNLLKTTMPHFPLIEEAVINILINNPNFVKKYITELKIDYFFMKSNKIIYDTIFELVGNNRSVNFITLVTKLQEKKRLKEIGGIQKIIELSNKFETPLLWDEYIKILKEVYLRRLIIEMGKEIIEFGYETEKNLDIIFEKIEKKISNINQQKISEKIYDAAEILNEIFKEIKDTKLKKNELGFKSSFRDLDAILQGFQKSDLIIIAGRPSMGKTAFSLNLAKNIVENYKIPLIIFSLEMSRQQIIYRFLSNISKINANKLRSGKLNFQEWKEFSIAMKKLSCMPIYISDNSSVTLSLIKEKIKKIFLEQKKSGIVIIDYLQLMRFSSKLENRVQEISYITQHLKIMAKEFNIPIIVLSQLNRSIESRINKKPILSDLRESGCISSFFNSNFLFLKSWNKINFIKKKNSSGFFFKGKKPLFLIIFKNNKFLSLTSNHKILSKKGWIKTSELTKKNFISYLQDDKNIINYMFTKIKIIEYIGIRNVYDKQIFVFHNYINNKFILHNSIEQDADVVIILYRDENQTHFQQKNLQIIIEFIIAKHRNGSIGTAQLIFNPFLTTFSDL